VGWTSLHTERFFPQHGSTAVHPNKGLLLQLESHSACLVRWCTLTSLMLLLDFETSSVGCQ